MVNMKRCLDGHAVPAHTKLLAAPLILCLLLAATGACLAAREVISLDGPWQIAQGSLEAMPTAFDHTVPVPGLVDMAQPAFTEVGVASTQRKAFWYRRSFRLRGAVPAVAVLKVTKAQFGTKAWMNGIEVGEHLGCFTPGYFDVAKALQGNAENTVVIRVGAFKDAVPPTVPTGTDYEKFVWTPGIYDAVTLTLTSSPYIVRAQVAPRIAAGEAVVEVVVKHVGDKPATVRVGAAALAAGTETRRVSSAAPRDFAGETPAPRGTAVPREVVLQPGEEKTVRLRVAVPKGHLWTPEDPFLYTLRCDAGTDALETRFGMREFGYDQKTGRAMLNGKPYFLRGTNFCLFRFFEDPLRGGLPWDRGWVRRLLTLPKDKLHMNSARVCIAPMPEFWYDIADETGWLFQDEFPIWGFDEKWSQEELVKEFGEWVHERCNHPSVAVWDACNETLTPRTGAVISAVQGLDLSNRPWDDGYSNQNRPGDAVEDHPYRFIEPSFKLEQIGSALDRSAGLRKPPVVINEYAWLWLNRDGTPTTLTKGVFDSRVGPNATPQQRQEFSAYNWAGLTEYWRARRDAAAVDEFCYLTYSMPNGRTGDHFIDLKNLVLDPKVVDYFGNSFAPLAVMIDDFEGPFSPGPTKVRVIISNDLYEAKAGTLRLAAMTPDEGKTVKETREKFEVAALGQTVKELTLALPAEVGKYRVVATLEVAGAKPVKSRRNLELVTAEEARHLRSISFGCETTASSEIRDVRGECPAKYATDGKTSTRWSSEFSDPQWLQVDLGAEHTISRVELQWEAACAKAYEIQVSDDGKAWRAVYKTESGAGGTEECKFAPAKCRYVRMYGTKRNGEWGYSLWEMRVFE